MLRKFALTVVIFFGLGVNMSHAQPAVDTTSVQPGTAVTSGGAQVALYEGSIKIGDKFAELLKTLDIDFPFNNRVTIVSVVPAINTPVCEIQTHTLAAAQDILPAVDRVTISRDLPEVQAQFARTAEITNVTFVSDQNGSFGKTTGLMIKGIDLLTRAVFVLDKEGVVQYIQVVPVLTHLPDLSKAIEVANELAK